MSLSFRTVLVQSLIGVFVNNFLPSTVGGDAAKVFYLGREHGYRVVTVSIVLDRLFGLGVLSALATAALWAGPISGATYGAVRVALTSLTAAFGLVVVLALLDTGPEPRRVARFGARAQALAEHLQRLRIDLATAVRSPRVWVNAAGAVASYVLLIALLYQAFVALEAGVQVGFLSTLSAVASTAVLSNLPVAINGLGLREQLHVLLLQPLGVPKEVAVAISLLLFGHLLIASVVGGLLWLSRPETR